MKIRPRRHFITLNKLFMHQLAKYNLMKNDFNHPLSSVHPYLLKLQGPTNILSLSQRDCIFLVVGKPTN